MKDVFTATLIRFVGIPSVMAALLFMIGGNAIPNAMPFVFALLSFALGALAASFFLENARTKLEFDSAFEELHSRLQGEKVVPIKPPPTH